MSVYTLSPNLTPNATDSSFYDWDTAALWLQGSVPDDPSAQVFLNNIGDEGYNIRVAVGESISIGSLSMPSNQLQVYGQLTSAGTITLSGAIGANGLVNMQGGSLAAQVLNIESAGPGPSGIAGFGTIHVAGPISNSGNVSASNGTLDLQSAYFSNQGTLEAYAGTLIVEPTLSQGFANYDYGVLVGGTYVASSGGTIDLKTAAPITSDDNAILSFYGAGNDIASYDPSSGHYVSLQSTLSLIRDGGSLQLEDASFAAAGSITIASSLELQGNSSFSAANVLYITTTGTVNFIDTLAPGGQQITARVLLDDGTLNIDAFGGGVAKIDAAVSGTGVITLAPQGTNYGYHNQIFYTTATAELTQAVSVNLAYSDGTGTFILDTPGSVTGHFQNFQAGDQIALPTISLASVSGFSYAGSASSGVLTVHENGTAIHLSFTGDYSTADFSIEVNPDGTGIVLIGVTPVATAAAHHV